MAFKKILLAIIGGVIIFLIILIAVAAHFRPANRISEMKENIPALREFTLVHSDSLEVILGIQRQLEGVKYVISEDREGISIRVYDILENRYSTTEVERAYIDESTNLNEVEKTALIDVYNARHRPYRSFVITPEGIEMLVNETPSGRAVASLRLTSNPRFDLQGNDTHYIEHLHGVWYAEIWFYHRG